MSAFYDIAPIAPDRNVWGDPYMETSWIAIDREGGKAAVVGDLSAPDIRICATTPVTLLCTGERCLAYCSMILQTRVQPAGDDDEGGAE